MAKNQSEPSMNGTTMPNNAGAIPSGATWGIDNLLTNAIIQSESIQEEDVVDDTQDQKGAMVNRLSYDRHWTLDLTFITNQMKSTGELSANIAQSGQYDFTYGGHKWFVNNVTYNGSYNGKKQYSLTAERWINYPAQS